MKVLGFSGYSGSGKTTLIEKLIAHLKDAGQRVSVIKHAHHAFDIDHEGKDSWRHRRAGAFEVVVASSRRIAKMREYEIEGEPTVHQLIAELVDCDWVLVEGFRHADLPKIEVWNSESPRADGVLYAHDPYVVAVVTNDPQRLPVPTGLPVFAWVDTPAIAQFLLSNPSRYDYTEPIVDAR